MLHSQWQRPRIPGGRALRGLVATAIALAGLILLSVPVFASWGAIAGTVSNQGYNSYYTPVHCVSSYGSGPQVAVTSWPGGNTDAIYLAVTVNGVTENFVKIPVYDWNITNVAYLAQGSCYQFAAHRDWNVEWWLTSTWGANLRS